MKKRKEKNNLKIENIVEKHLESLLYKLKEAGVKYEINNNSIILSKVEHLKPVNIKTTVYPGFPTDLQPQMGVVLSIANGTSKIIEGIWESRFQYTDELNKMGANITAQGKSAFFEGVEKLYGSPVYSTDLRAGAALIIAGIIANGTTEIYNLEHIDRGYENIEEKFRNLGAIIERVNE